MYSVGTALPVEELEPGTFMLSGPAMSGKLDLLVDLIIEGLAQDEGALVATTNEGANQLIKRIDDRATTRPRERLRFVDCVSERQGSGGQLPEEIVEYVSSPADLTGVGIAVSEQLRRFLEEDVDRVRMGFHSISTLLMYAELETVFRFLHVLTGRVDGIEGLGLFAIDPTTHDDDTVNTLTQLFDGVIDVRPTEEGREVRLRGVPGASNEWVATP